jgi:HAD superfamily hydrolase (TIGR01484 family)
MKELRLAPRGTFASVRVVLTDMDETLTFRGRLAAATYAALERLGEAGVTVIPVTAAPAGWCDQMARMWPVHGVIGENGGLHFSRAAEPHGLRRWFWHGVASETIAQRLAEIGASIQAALPFARLAEDQPFRQTSLAFAIPQSTEERQVIVAALKAEGASVTINNQWILGWLGDYDKLAAARAVLGQFYDIDIERDRNAILYSGDSLNDAPMFDFFRHTVGVSTVIDYLPELPTPPHWIAAGPGGTGFVEIAEAVMASR